MLGMGNEGGEKGKLIDLGQKRRERNLPEPRLGAIEQDQVGFAEAMTRDFEEHHDRLDQSILGRIQSAEEYTDDDIREILQKAMQAPESYNASFLYAVCAVYLERERKRREEQHPDV